MNLPVDQPEGPGNGPIILLIEDDDATRPLLARLLQSRGFRTREARNGAEGLDTLQRHPDISVVVLDFHMPLANGEWFRERQLADPAIARVPVVVFTGRMDLPSNFPVADVLYKPLSIDQLCAAVERYCRG
jgi:CheY-like chemotaxis protein